MFPSSETSAYNPFYPIDFVYEETENSSSPIQESTTINLTPLPEEPSFQDYNLTDEECVLKNLFLSLDSRNINSTFFQTRSLIQKKLSEIISHREKVENPPYSIFTSENGRYLFQFLLETSSSEEASSLLSRLTKLKMISQDSETAISTWISVCSRYLDRSKWGFDDEAKQDVRKAYQTWMQGINLGVPLDKQTSLEAYLFLSNLCDKLSKFDDPESISLTEKALELFKRQKLSLSQDSQKAELYGALKLIFPERPHQVILLLNQILTTKNLDSESIRKLLEEMLTPYLEKNEADPLNYDTLVLVKALFNLVNKKPSHSKGQPQKKELSFYQKLEKALIVTPEQHTLINLEKFKADLKEKNWSNAFTYLPNLIKECHLPSQKQFLIASLRQIFQEIPKLKSEQLKEVERLIKCFCLVHLFKNNEIYINFLLDSISLIPKNHVLLNTTFIHAILACFSNPSKAESATLSSATSQRLAEFFTNMVKHSVPSNAILKNVEKELRQVIPNFICVYNQNTGPHTFELCKLLTTLSLHGQGILYSEEAITSVLAICSQVLRFYSGDSSQLESIHQMFDSLKWFKVKKPSTLLEQVELYQLLMNCLLQHKDSPTLLRYAEQWFPFILKHRLNTNDLADNVKLIKDFDHETAFFSVDLHKKCAALIYELAFEVNFMNSSIPTIETAGLFAILRKSRSLGDFFFSNTCTFLEKLLNGNFQTETTEENSFALICKTVRLLLHFHPEESKQIEKFIKKFVFILTVDRITPSDALFTAHVHYIGLIRSFIEAESAGTSKLFQETILLCKVYCGEPIFDAQIITHEERELIKSLITKLINSSSPYNLRHFITISSNLRVSQNNPYDFSDYFIPLLQSLPQGKIASTLLNPAPVKVFIQCWENYFFILCEICKKGPSARPNVLLTALESFKFLFKENIIKNHYTKFYEILNSLMPYYVKALTNSSTIYGYKKSPFNIAPLLESQTPHTAEEAQKRADSFFYWLQCLKECGDTATIFLATQYITNCSPTDNLFSGLPGVMQKMILDHWLELETE